MAHPAFPPLPSRSCASSFLGFPVSPFAGKRAALLLQMGGVAVGGIWIRDRALRSASVDISPLLSLCGLRQGDREPSNLPSCLGTGQGGQGLTSLGSSGSPGALGTYFPTLPLTYSSLFSADWGPGLWLTTAGAPAPLHTHTSHKRDRCPGCCSSPSPASVLAPFLHTRFLFPCPLRTPWRGPQPRPPALADKERTKTASPQHPSVPSRPLPVPVWVGHQPQSCESLTPDLCPKLPCLTVGPGITSRE